MSLGRNEVPTFSSSPPSLRMADDLTDTKCTRSERASTFALLATGLSVAVIGFLALLGWMFDVSVLTNWKAGANPMAPSTVMLFVMYGVALCLAARLPQGGITPLLITFCGAVGAMTSLLLFALRLLAVYWPGERLGLGIFSNAPIGYISPITAFSFLLAYVSLLASLSHGARRSWRSVLLWVFGGFVTLISVALLLAYTFDAYLLFGKTLIPPALNTSLSLLIMGLAQIVLAARYTGWLDVSSDTDGIKLLPYALVLLAFAAGTILVSYYYYRSTELTFRQEMESQLLTVSELKADELVRWRMERLWDGVLSQNPAITTTARRLLETPHSRSAQQDMLVLLGKYQRSIGYDRAYLLDAKGVTRISVSDTAEPASAILAEGAVSSLRMGQVMLQDFYRDENDQHVYLALMVPILDRQDGNQPLGVVVLRIDPTIYLYPHIKSWPTPNATAETLLVRRDGNDVLFLNDLRFQANAALNLRFPLNRNTELPAAKAVLGQSGIVEGVDYQGVPVIAAVRAVPDSPWYIVTRIDTAEIYAPLRERIWLTILLVSILVCGGGMVAIFLWRQQKHAFYRKRHKLTLALQVNEERHQTILNTAMDGFCLIDMQGRLLEVNETYCRMSGYSEQELLTMRVADLNAVETAEDIATHIKNIMAQGQDRFESRHRRKDGSLFDVEVSIQYQPVEGGRCVVFLQDISQRKQAEQALKDAARRKDEFLAMLAHELRNPLAPIRNAVEVQKLANLDSSRLAWCNDVIERQVEHLIRLVDDLLDVSRISRGLVELKKEPLEIHDFIQPAVETSQPLIDARRHKFAMTLPPEPLWVQGDRIRLAQVVSNLINNAAKYTEEGGDIKLSVEPAGDEVCIRITDNGCGIDPADLPNLFELFYQVERHLARSQGGLGIGLSLVHNLVAKHGGQVRAMSAGRGLGSEFEIRLPRLMLPEPAVVCCSSGPAPNCGKLRILVVDDNRDAAESLVLLLGIDGHHVQMANDGPAALEMARAEDADVIILDIGLPGMDGYSVAQAIRRSNESSRALLIAVTGYGQPDDREKSRAAGFDAHLVKPIDFETLRKLLAEHG